MRAKNLIILIVLTVLCSSCHNESKHYALTEAQWQLIPYKLGDTVNFMNSSGEVFDAIVIKDTTDWSTVYRIYEVEYRSIRFSEFDNIVIGLSIEAHNHGSKGIFSIGVSQLSDNFYLSYNEEGQFVTDTEYNLYKQYLRDSLEIGDKMYYDVVEHSSYRGIPSQLFYNKTYGILQIKRDGEDFLTLKN